MAKFVYSMENILKIKVKLEEQKRMVLGRAMSVYQLALKQQDDLVAKLNFYRDQFMNQSASRLNGSQLRQLNEQVAYYERSLAHQKLVVEKALAQVEKAREALKEALEEKKIQEKLKEKALERFMEEEKMAEQKVLDEIVGYRYAVKEEE